MMRRVFPVLAPLWLLASSALPGSAATRPGAPRTLTLSFGGESPAAGTGAASALGSFVSDAVPVGIGTGYTLLFASASRGTRNIYRATPVRRAPNRPPVWTAQPLTLLGAPNFVDAPAPFPGGNTALCVVGSLTDDQNRDAPRGGKDVTLRGTIARLDLTSGALETVISDTHCAAPAPSPDGRRLAWSAERSGTESVWVALLGGERFRVANKARRPVWLDAKTLLYESVDNGRRGIYRVTLKPDGSVLSDTRRQLWPYGGEVAVSPDGDTLCLATQNSAGSATTGGATASGAFDGTRLYMLSSDGSGARALAGTDGARHPHWLPDGSGVVYDAPTPDEKGLSPRSAQAPRALWLLPMRSTAPVATLIEARPSLLDNRMVEVYGTAWCEGDNAPQVKLEAGRGEDPQQWQELPAGHPPIQQGIVGRWMPPAEATGTWTLRLSVTSSSGELSQNTLPVALPLIAAPQPPSPLADLPPAGSFVPPVASGSPLAPPATTARPGRGFVAPMPLENLPPRMPVPNAAPDEVLPPPVVTPPGKTPSPNKIPERKPPSRVPPAIVPPLSGPPGTSSVGAPGTNPSVRGTPVTGAATPEEGMGPSLLPSGPLPSAPTKAEVDGVPSEAGTTLKALEPPLTLRPLPRKTPVPANETRRASETRRSRSRKSEKKPSTSPAKVPDVGDAARIDVAGTPAEMEASETLDVVATLRNRGRSTWTTSGPSPVRLLIRWTDLTGGYRVRWAIVWPQSPTKPGQTTQVRFAVTAPSRPGRYKVTYALLRVPGGTVQQPRESGDAPWPDEFGGAAYEVVVR